jgi:hypothetical protein
MTLLDDAGSDDPAAVRELASRYLAFVNHAFERTSGRFRNFLSYGRQWLEPAGSEDSHGRALWALGTVVGRATDPGRQSLASDLFHAAIPSVTTFTSPRAWAYTLLAIDEYLRAFQGDSSVEALRLVLAERLLGLFQRTRRENWYWFEDSVTYCNARLSQALIVAGSRMQREEMTEAGMRSLEWLVDLQASPRRPSISSRLKPAPPRPRVSRRTASAKTDAGRSMGGEPSTGSSDRTTSTSGSTTPRPVAAAMASIRIASTRTRAPRPPCPFCWRSARCGPATGWRVNPHS